MKTEDEYKVELQKELLKRDMADFNQKVERFEKERKALDQEKALYAKQVIDVEAMKIVNAKTERRLDAVKDDLKKNSDELQEKEMTLRVRENMVNEKEERLNAKV